MPAWDAAPFVTAQPPLPCSLPQLRARVWPLLLGVEGGGGPVEAAEYAARAAQGHKDSQVVTADMARSLWTFTEGACCLPACLPACC